MTSSRAKVFTETSSGKIVGKTSKKEYPFVANKLCRAGKIFKVTCCGPFGVVLYVHVEKSEVSIRLGIGSTVVSIYIPSLKRVSDFHRMLEAAAEFSDFVRFATSIFSRKGPVRINALQDLAFGGKGPVLTVQFVATCAFDITFLVVGDCCRLCTSVVPSSVSNVLKLLFIKLSCKVST